MITIIYGVPGSGKSYFAVWWIKKRVLEEGDVFYRVRSDRLLITNLKLRLDSEEGYIYVEDPKELAKYMDVDFWKANFHLLQGRKVVFVVDECQRFFYFYGSDVRVLFFLQYHRHLGMDILLITQTPKSIPGKVFELCEYVVESVPKSVNPFGFRTFRYRVLHPLDRKEVLRRFHLSFESAVFYLYHDMIYSPEEGEERVANAYVRYYVMLVGVIVALVGFLYLFFSSFSGLASRVQPQSLNSQSLPVVQGGATTYTYEDLITEEEERNYVPRSESFKRSEEFKVGESGVLREPKGYGYIVVEVVRSSVRGGGGEDIELSSGPKIVELP
jgi:zona occludens toxin